MNDVDMIEPTGTPVEFEGQTLYIKPLTVGKIPAFARVVKPMAADLAKIMAAGSDPAAWLDLIADHGENLVGAVSIAAEIPVEQINAATPDQLVGLVIKTLEVNADFFKGRMIPAIMAAVQQVKPKAVAPGAGPTP